jgi:hypothetical protein
LQFIENKNVDTSNLLDLSTKEFKNNVVIKTEFINNSTSENPIKLTSCNNTEPIKSINLNDNTNVKTEKQNKLPIEVCIKIITY